MDMITRRAGRTPVIESAGRTASLPTPDGRPPPPASTKTPLTGARPLRARDLRRANRSALLRRLYFDGPLSRQELITSVGLSAASVSRLTDLVAENLVVEAGSIGSDGGRPRIPLRVNQAAFAVIGSGVGAAIVVDGTAYPGASSSAGEWGHTTVAVAGRRCRCGARGCIEAYVGAAAIVDRYAESLREERPLLDDQDIALGRILDSANSAGDDETAEQARIVLDHTTTYLGIGSANLINLLNPERVILGGWAGLMLGHRMLGTTEEVAGR
jgi:hypothetical protein